MKIIIEAEISDTEVKKLEEMGYDVNYPFSTKVTLDYGDKVIYGNGKITISNKWYLHTKEHNIVQYVSKNYTRDYGNRMKDY